MIFNTHTLTPPLDSYLESMFHFKGFVPEHSLERVVPTGHVFILFELDGIERNRFENDSLKPIQSFTKVWVSGMHKNYITISSPPQAEMFVIQFKPYGAYPFLHTPLQNLNEKIVDADTVLGATVLALRDELLAKETSEEKFKVAETWLTHRFQKQKTPPAELLDIVERLQKEAVADYPKIITNYSKTHKHLIDQFKKYIGLTPKYYQRILRFQEILQQIHKSEKIEWSQIAYQCEYADQSHFIKEFKHFSGFNPQKFIDQDLHQDPPNFFPLDGKG